MNTRRMQRWLGGAAVCVFCVAVSVYPTLGAHALPSLSEARITEPLPEPTSYSAILQGGHASKEALQASQYAMLRKRLQATQPNRLAATSRWFEEE